MKLLFNNAECANQLSIPPMSFLIHFIEDNFKRHTQNKVLKIRGLNPLAYIPWLHGIIDCASSCLVPINNRRRKKLAVSRLLTPLLLWCWFPFGDACYNETVILDYFECIHNDFFSGHCSITELWDSGKIWMWQPIWRK